MALDYATLDFLRQHHPAWRLLRSDHAPLVAAFLQRIFVLPNVREMAQADLAEVLEDELFALRERLGADAFPKSAASYLDDWAADDKGWLRKFYRRGSDEPYFDLTPATEKAIAWLANLEERAFVGTESRLLVLFALLKEMSDGTQTDPAARLAELRRRRDEIDTEMKRVAAGDLPLLDDTALRDRFQQFSSLARELLADFRQVEHNFRGLDRKVRERIALWDAGKGALLEEIMGDRDAISDSDQGRSFRAFWDFLMSSRKQEELTELLERVLDLPAVAELRPDPRVRRVHYDWLEAGEHTQRTVAQLSGQLRRFLDDQVWQENRRILEILRSIEGHAIAVRNTPPKGDLMALDDPAPSLELPLERPLFQPPFRAALAVRALEAGEGDLDASALFSQVMVDKTALARNVRQTLQSRLEVSLGELCADHPLTHGLAEVVAYLELAGPPFKVMVHDDVFESVRWRAADGSFREATLPKVVYCR